MVSPKVDHHALQEWQAWKQRPIAHHKEEKRDATSSVKDFVKDTLQDIKDKSAHWEAWKNCVQDELRNALTYRQKEGEKAVL